APPSSSDAFAYVSSLLLTLENPLPGEELTSTSLSAVPWDLSRFSDRFVDLVFFRGPEQTTEIGSLQSLVAPEPSPVALVALLVAALGLTLPPGRCYRRST